MESSISNGPEVNPMHPANLFDVAGIVAVVTGGGTGEYSRRVLFFFFGNKLQNDTPPIVVLAST